MYAETQRQTGCLSVEEVGGWFNPGSYEWLDYKSALNSGRATASMVW